MPAYRLLEVTYTPEHWSQNCGCVIPAAWIACVETVVHGGDEQTHDVRGRTEAEAVFNAAREFPDLDIPESALSKGGA